MLGEVRQLCDQVVILHRGEVRLQTAIGLASQSDGVTLSCTVQSGEKRLVAAMHQLEGIRSVRVAPVGADNEASFTLTFDHATLPEKQVFSLCSAMGAPILRMTRSDDDLEQVFLRAISE